MRLASGLSSRGVYGLLDIGSSKIVCAIARLHRDAHGRHGVDRIAGLGFQRSRGIKAGMVVNIDDAEAAVRAAVAQAEGIAGETIDGVIATVACGRLRSHRFRAHVEPASGVVTRDDIERLHAGASSYAQRGGRTLIHWNRIGFSIDGSQDVPQPIGLSASRLTGTFHIVSADESPVANLVTLIERCYLNVDALVPAPVASALAVTTPQERHLGVTAIDMGGGTISFATFSNHRLMECGVIPVGGNHVTFDIARRFARPVSEAERLKTLYGSLASGPSDAHVFVDAGSGDEEEAEPVTRADLNAIIAQRLYRQLDTVAQRTNRLPADGSVDPIPAVLSGGASQIPALAMVAANRLQRPVRAGRPLALPGLPESVTGPAFAAIAGLTRFPPGRAAPPAYATGGGYLDRLKTWVQERF